MATTSGKAVPYYRFFSAVLEDPHIGLRTIALTGELISGYARMTLLMARTKGKLDPDVWWEAAEGFIACQKYWEDAWRRYSERGQRRTDDDSRLLHEFFEDAASRLKDLVRRLSDASGLME